MWLGVRIIVLPCVLYTFADFYTYELASPRTYDTQATMGFGDPSDMEMAGLAGFAGRKPFLQDFFAWLVDHMNNERSPLEAAEEISPSTPSVRLDIARLKRMHRVTETDDTERCNDYDMPFPS